jgi:hypothetical protein
LSAVIRWFAVLLLAATSLASAAEGIRVVEVRPIDARKLVPLPNGTHQLKLYAHMFRGTQWKPDDVVDAVGGAARLLAQCGITLTTAELRVVEAPAPFRYFDTPRSRELLRSLDTPRPAVFFVEDTRNDPAFDAEAVGRANAARRPELVNTVWVAHGARDLPFALAHELVHVLSDSGQHTDEPRNLMRSETAPENTQLNAAQCERMRSRGEANGLLQNHAQRTDTAREPR